MSQHNIGHHILPGAAIYDCEAARAPCSLQGCTIAYQSGWVLPDNSIHSYECSPSHSAAALYGLFNSFAKHERFICQRKLCYSKFLHRLHRFPFQSVTLNCNITPILRPPYYHCHPALNTSSIALCRTDEVAFLVLCSLNFPTITSLQNRNNDYKQV